MTSLLRGGMTCEIGWQGNDSKHMQIQEAKATDASYTLMGEP